jgi:metal-responsive CopG/Arc/MetJ family transcriptional regulator
MKTAISIPNELFAAAETFAREKGLRRSDLYSRALLQYLQAHRTENITEQLNAIYAEEESTLDAPFKLAQAKILQRNEW